MAEAGRRVRRPPGSMGNPFRVGADAAGVTIDAHEAVRLYRLHLDDALQTKCGARAVDLEQLRGRDLLCWCPLIWPDGQPAPCHADVLLDLANRPRTDEQGQQSSAETGTA